MVDDALLTIQVFLPSVSRQNLYLPAPFLIATSVLERSEHQQPDLVLCEAGSAPPRALLSGGDLAAGERS